jgi:hypothetical protein
MGAISSEIDRGTDGLMRLKRHSKAARLPPPRLLGAFEPVLLGWRSREFVLGDATEVVTVNGIFKPIVLVKGRATGTWKMPGGKVELSLWRGHGRTTLGALEQEAAAVERYLAG